jgi:hypothetical protein
MPQRNRPGGRRVGRLLVFSLIAWALVALGRAPGPTRSGVEAPAPLLDDATSASPLPPARRTRRSPRRLAASFALSVLFFAGASLSAVAGDQAVSLLGEEDAAEIAAADGVAANEEQAREETALEEPTTEVPAPVEPAPIAPAPAEETPQPAAETEPEAQPEEPAPATFLGDAVAEPAAPPASAEPSPAPADEPAAEREAQPEYESTGTAAQSFDSTPSRTSTPRRRASKSTRPAKAPPVVVRVPEHEPEHAPLDPEASEPGVDATVWLHRTLADPTPPSLRLSPEYASRLVALSRAEGADWSLVLGVLRAETSRPQAPVRPATIAETAERLVGLGSPRNAWAAALALTGRTATSDRAVALARYYRAIGIGGLVHGLRAEQERLVKELLADERVTIYAGGREDLLAGRVEVRVVALIAYLAEAYGQVTVSSLISGHRLYARPGVVSAHVYGAAVDIAALGGTSILGHQQPGSVTERAVRDLLLLPAEMRARQVISLIGMGGPSFALANHYDHIHVGF